MSWKFRRGGNPDAAQGAIVDALRRVGASVVIISKVGGGCPDLCVGYRGQTFLLEVKSVITSEGKDGYTRTRKTRVDEVQVEFAAAWRGGPLHIVHTPEEALEAIGAVAPTSSAPASTSLVGGARRPVKHPAR